MAFRAEGSETEALTRNPACVSVPATTISVYCLDSHGHGAV